MKTFYCSLNFTTQEIVVNEVTHTTERQKNKSVFQKPRTVIGEKIKVFFKKHRAGRRAERSKIPAGIYAWFLKNTFIFKPQEFLQQLLELKFQLVPFPSPELVFLSEPMLLELQYPLLQ